ncbi:MAG: AraC family transcriptional regulator, partial [Actinomycetota bacterium]|nr:AraC family transcriptional regulator [Actinomycetota bacterium]
MSYREHASPPALSAWLECAWQRDVGGGKPVRVVPDGCIDIVWIENAGTQIVGANTTAFLVHAPPGTRVVGARLRPGAAPPLLGIDGVALRDARAAIEAVWEDDGRRLAAQLDEADDRVATLL